MAWLACAQVVGTPPPPELLAELIAELEPVLELVAELAPASVAPVTLLEPVLDVEPVVDAVLALVVPRLLDELAPDVAPLPL